MISSGSENSTSISAIVTLHQSQTDSFSRTRIHQTNRNQLIGILTENAANASGNSTTRKKTICIEPKVHRAAVGNFVEVQLQRGESEFATRPVGVSSSGRKSNSIVVGDPAPGKQKIPRPANAFMLFANEWRKRLAIENPRESNKDISVRLVP